MNKTLTTLFAQQMTRKEFLTKIGFILLTLTGINALIKSFSRPAQQQETGFGSGPYGK